MLKSSNEALKAVCETYSANEASKAVCETYSANEASKATLFPLTCKSPPKTFHKEPLYLIEATLDTSNPAELVDKCPISSKFEATLIAKSLISTSFEFKIVCFPLTVKFLVTKSPVKLKFIIFTVSKLVNTSTLFTFKLPDTSNEFNEASLFFNTKLSFCGKLSNFESNAFNEVSKPDFTECNWLVKSDCTINDSSFTFIALPLIFNTSPLTPNVTFSPNLRLLSLKNKCLILYSAEPKSNWAFFVGIKWQLKSKLLPLFAVKTPDISKLLTSKLVLPFCKLDSSKAVEDEIWVAKAL